MNLDTVRFVCMCFYLGPCGNYFVRCMLLSSATSTCVVLLQLVLFLFSYAMDTTTDYLGCTI